MKRQSRDGDGGGREMGKHFNGIWFKELPGLGWL